MLRVGLTGGIACGKTRVLQRLAARGCRTLDLDQSAREVTAPGSPALAEIAAGFGSGVLQDGRLDRAALAALVFADPGARAKLNAIVHPRVRELERRWSESQPQDGVLVVDAALLVETGAHLRFDRLLVVHCPRALQLSRLRARDHLDEGAARARIEAQMPVASKREFGHFAIDSSGSVEDTDRASDDVFEQLERLAQRPPRELVPLPRLLGAVLHGPRLGPRGLSPGLLLRLASQSGSLELQALATRLDPPATGAWYEAALPAAPAVGAASLGPALVAWALASRPPDADFLVSAAATLARLTHVDPAQRAAACQLALLLQDVVLAGQIPPDLESLSRAHAVAAARWGGRDPGASLAPILAAVLAHPTQPEVAREDASRRGGFGELAAALVGCAIGASAHAAPEPAAWLAELRSERA